VERNAGSRYGPASGLDFEQVEEGIALEDDCVAGRGFFAFRGALLGRFREDRRVVEIGGSNYPFGQPRGSGS
jgi:hypothetical protein